MYHVKARSNKREKRKLRVRKDIFGTKDKPRFSVFRSLRYMYAQIIDDVAGKTLVSAQTKEGKGTKSEQSYELGKELAQKAAEKKIKEVVFDRNGYQYRGRVQKLAEGAREGGLKF